MVARTEKTEIPSTWLILCDSSTSYNLLLQIDVLVGHFSNTSSIGVREILRVRYPLL